MDWKSSLESLRASFPDADTATEDAAEATSEAAESTEKARLDIILDRKGRKGKPATIVAGFTISDDAVEELARWLRQRLGVGGSSRGGEILIQGDKRQETLTLLTQRGFRARVI